MATRALSSAFIWRRVHSLMGLWLVIYLIEHLLVNSQAALWIGDDGAGFVRMVNGLESLPYLQVIEWMFIGVPLLIHGGWGIHRALQAKMNALPYERNRAFTWQRLTSWILLVGIVAHVVQMRFVGYPTKVEVGNQLHYLVKLSFDEGLYTLAPRLHVKLYSEAEIQAMQQTAAVYSAEEARVAEQAQNEVQQCRFAQVLAGFHLKSDEVVAAAESPGTAMLLMVRGTFKSVWMAALYTVFVLAAAYHAFNGFWTALITWGAVLSFRSQRAMLPVSVVGILILSFFGLAAIWGTYWVNLCR